MTDRIGAERSAAAGVACSEANQRWTSCRVIPAASFEPRQDLVPVIVAVDLERAGFPVPPVTLEHFFRDRLERRRRRRSAAGQNGLRPRTGFFLGDVLADDPPDAPAVALAVDEVSLPARWKDPDAEPLEFVVANVVGGFARLESVDPALVETDHASFPRNRCRRGTKQALRPSPPTGFAKKKRAISKG